VARLASSGFGPAPDVGAGLGRGFARVQLSRALAADERRPAPRVQAPLRLAAVSGRWAAFRAGWGVTLMAVVLAAGGLLWARFGVQ
jgi:hypothetical protein